MDSTIVTMPEGYDLVVALFPLLVGGLIIPIVGWLKKFLPVDLPIKQVAMVSAFCFLGVWLLSKIFAPDMTTDQMITYVLGSQVASQYMREGFVTAKKLKNGG